MKNIIRSVLAAVLCLNMIACSSLWNLTNRNSLIANVTEVLAATGEDQLELTCQMVDTTRTGYCIFDAHKELIEQIATRLGLDYRTASLEEPDTLPPLGSEGMMGCLSAGVFDNIEGLPAYWVGGRPITLSLSDGGQFEYLLLLYNSLTEQSCVQVSYAYG